MALGPQARVHGTVQLGSPSLPVPQVVCDPSSDGPPRATSRPSGRPECPGACAPTSRAERFRRRRRARKGLPPKLAHSAAHACNPGAGHGPNVVRLRPGRRREGNLSDGVPELLSEVRPGEEGEPHLHASRSPGPDRECGWEFPSGSCGHGIAEDPGPLRRAKLRSRAERVFLPAGPQGLTVQSSRHPA